MSASIEPVFPFAQCHAQCSKCENSARKRSLIWNFAVKFLTNFIVIQRMILNTQLSSTRVGNYIAFKPFRLIKYPA